MPVQYRSILEEHKAVRRAAGLFDVSHMGEVDVRGPEAGKFLNHLVTNDVAKLFPGRVLYSPMCYPSGGVVDDLLVYMKGADDYFLCINAGNIAKDLAWIREQAAKFAVTITDRCADYALLAVQGPRAPAIVQSLTGAKLELVKYYHFVEGTVAGVHALISRTGYTGEDGVEIPAYGIILLELRYEPGAFARMKHSLGDGGDPIPDDAYINGRVWRVSVGFDSPFDLAFRD